MRKKAIVIFISILSAFIIISSGYGKWHKQLFIEGNIDVIPNPNVIKGLELEMGKKQQELQDLYEEQQLLEEQELQEQKTLAGEELVEEVITEEINIDKSSIEDNTNSNENIHGGQK